jgi:hypothetical protein
VKNRKPDRVGRSSRSARSTVAPSTAPPKPAASTSVGDVEMVRERTRGRIALAVIALPALVVLLGGIGLALGKLSVNEWKELVSSQTGLIMLGAGGYFGGTMPGRSRGRGH